VGYWCGQKGEKQEKSGVAKGTHAREAIAENPGAIQLSVVFCPDMRVNLVAKKFNVPQEYAQLIYDQTSSSYLDTATDLRLLEKGDAIVCMPTQVCYRFVLCMALTANNNFLTVRHSVKTLAATSSLVWSTPLHPQAQVRNSCTSLPTLCTRQSYTHL
jgi:hypothetical protein